MDNPYKDPEFFKFLEEVGLTEEEYHHRRGNYKHLSRNLKPSNLPPWQLGQFNNPEYRDKAAESNRRRNWENRKKKEILQTGFGQSKISDPKVQAQLIDTITDMALEGDKQALKLLIDMNAIKQPAEVAEAEKQAKEEYMKVEDAMSILKKAEK